VLVPDSFACARWRFKVQPGDVLATLDNTASVALRFNLNEADIGRVQLGTPVEVTTPAYPDRRFSGKVASFASRLDIEQRTLEAKASVANGDGLLRPAWQAQLDEQQA